MNLRRVWSVETLARCRKARIWCRCCHELVPPTLMWRCAGPMSDALCIACILDFYLRALWVAMEVDE